MAEWRRRFKQLATEHGARGVQTAIARSSGASVQAICDVVKGRRPPNAKLLKWLGFEIGYMPIRRRRQETVTQVCEADRTAATPQQAAQGPATLDQPPQGAGG